MNEAVVYIRVYTTFARDVQPGATLQHVDTNLLCYSSSMDCSLVEGEEPVAETEPEGGNSIHAPESSVALVGPSEELLMGAIAEGCIGAHLAVAELEVAGLANIESDRAATGKDPLALTIAEWGVLGMSATAPIVHLSSVEIDVSWEDTCECRHRGWSVFALFIWS